ncbi:MAG: RDD family protein [Verrucomicrobiota bacterium]|nr:RDD family protein [Limisphaera sp.]MDW8380571.1 RDD family protein [Verrucomicrobiota bacterium]
MGISEELEANEKNRADTVRHALLSSIGKDLELPQNEEADAVVAIGGNARIMGHVHEAVLAVDGNITVEGIVEGDVVVVAGSVHLTPQAEVVGDILSVGGTVTIEPGALHKGRIQQLQWGDWRLTPLGLWLTECVLKLRPLSLAVPWVWIGFALFAVFSLLIAFLFPRAVETCANAVEARPASSLLIGAMTKMLVPVLCILLALTGVGLFLLPLVGIAVVLAGIVGKVGVLAYLGHRLTGLRPKGRLPVVITLLTGLALLAILYTMPVVGFLTWAITGAWGLGTAVLALWFGIRDELNAPAPLTNRTALARPEGPTGTGASAACLTENAQWSAPVQPEAAHGIAHDTLATAPGAGALAGSIVASGHSAARSSSAEHAGMSVPVWAWPRVGFWERMGAGVVDCIVVSLLGILGGGLPLVWVVVFLYFVFLWTWKGTTVGGAIFKLQVVRTDGQPVRLEVALVRALGAVVSAAALFVGFLWIAWDSERQAWHDKLAGTVVVRLPRSVALV